MINFAKCFRYEHYFPINTMKNMFNDNFHIKVTADKDSPFILKIHYT